MRKFKALGNPTRLRLLHILYHYELSVNELVELLAISQSGVSSHLKILADAGLARFRRDGMQVFYSASRHPEINAFITDILRHYPKCLPENEDLVLAAGMLDARAKRAREFFDGIAEKWDELNSEILGDFDLYGYLSKIMPVCEVAADLGCGTGHILDAMLNRARLCIGVDASPSMIELCRKRHAGSAYRYGSLSLRLGELDHLPIRNGEVNFASINLVLHHLPTPAAVFPELFRILAPGGMLFIADLLRHNNEDMRIRYGDQWLGFEAAELENFLFRAQLQIRFKDIVKIGKGLSLIMLMARPARQLS